MLNGIARLIYSFGDDLKDDIFKEKLGRVPIKELSRNARDRKAGSLGFSEAMLLIYNQKTKKPLRFEQLYAHKSKKHKQQVYPEQTEPTADVGSSSEAEAKQMELF